MNYSVGDNFTRGGHYYILNHISPKNPDLDIQFDMYHFLDDQGNEKVLGQSNLNKMTKVDNNIPVEVFRNNEKAIREFNAQTKYNNDIIFNAPEDMPNYEIERLMQEHFEKKVVPARNRLLEVQNELKNYIPDHTLDKRTQDNLKRYDEQLAIYGDDIYNNVDLDPDSQGSSQVINQTFGGANPNRNVPEVNPFKDKFETRLKNMQNPGPKSHKSFTYNDRQYIMESNLSLGENGLFGDIISMEGETLSVMDEFADINKAIMDGDWETASNLLESFESASSTYGSGAIEAKKRKWKKDHPEVEASTPESTPEGPETNRQRQRTTEANTSGPEVNTRKGKIKKVQNVNRAKKVAKDIKFKGAAKNAAFSIADAVMDNVDDTLDEMVEQVANFKMPSGWAAQSTRTVAGYTDEQLEALAEGNTDLLEELKRQRNRASEQIFKEDLKNGKINFNSTGFEYEGNPNQQAENLRYDYRRVEVDENGNLVKGQMKSVNKTAEELMDDVPNDLIDDLFGDFKVTPQRLIGMGTNAYFAIKDYKDARRQGHGVISSAARAGVQFAVGEVLGGWGQLAMFAAQAPRAAIKGAELLYKENRRMNSAANHQTFGDASFQDSQQLATMRQSGMEMAKMAQYNLQQTLMGNEATYLHR